jgi:Kef-type K+ transport system membrane component KefB
VRPVVPGPNDVGDRVLEYWDWIAVALFLLIPVDLLTTLYAARAVGAGAESNPLMRWALRQGVLTLILVNVAAVIVAVVLFYGLVELLEAVPRHRRRYAVVVMELWLGVVLAAGLAIFANNLSVVVLGESLL